MKEKQEYIVPVIKKIKLDNEISLQLESSPPDGPGETSLLTPGKFNTDPFNSSIS